MTKPNPIAAAMALAFDVMENTDVPKRLRDRAKALFAEHAPEVLDPTFDPLRALMNIVEKRKLERNTKPTTADAAAISDIFTASVKAEEAAEPITAATVRADAVETLSNLMTDESVSHADRADIAKYFIESYAPSAVEAKEDALKTLRDLINDEYAPDAFRANIAKYVIESRIG